MAFEPYSGFRKKGARGMTARFKGTSAFLSSELVRRAGEELVARGSLDPGQTLRFVELWFDRESDEVGIKPVGHRGLEDDEVMARSDGRVRKIHGTKSAQVSVAGFRETYAIEDGTKVDLELRIIVDRRLPEGLQDVLIFAGKVPR